MSQRFETMKTRKQTTVEGLREEGMWHAFDLIDVRRHDRAAVDAGTPARQGSNATQSRATVELLILI